VGVETRYGLVGPWIESRLGGIFRTRPDRFWGPTSFLYNRYREVALTTHLLSSVEVKEGVEVYFYSLCGAFVACSTVNFTFTTKK